MLLLLLLLLVTVLRWTILHACCIPLVLPFSSVLLCYSFRTRPDSIPPAPPAQPWLTEAGRRGGTQDFFKEVKGEERMVRVSGPPHLQQVELRQLRGGVWRARQHLDSGFTNSI